MRVIALPEVRQYLKELIQLLYEKDYFGFEDSANQYVDELFSDIMNTLPLRLKRPAPPYFNRYGKGMLYAVFKKNNRTQWYVFFTTYEDMGETVYLVRYINNNHVIAKALLI